MSKPLSFGYMLNTMAGLLPLLLSFLVTLPKMTVAEVVTEAVTEAVTHNVSASHADFLMEAQEGHEEIEPLHAVFFPSFTLTLGVIAFLLLSRYAKALPYIAVMFLLGAIMGIVNELRTFYGTNDGGVVHIRDTLKLWVPINSEVLLLVFLPGLIFKEAMGLNVNLFRLSFNQLFIYAFPLVLAGTVLTALVGYYVFPYNWSFNLAMTFGSILSATNPVAIAALLESVSAPPRLKIHVAGEALLNDGAAIVFFSIFSARYLFELDLGMGEDIDLGTGISMFFQKSIGSACIGFLFGLVMCALLFVFHRRFNREENVVEVTATIALAYLGYYVAEAVCHTSGVIVTLT